MCRPGREGGGVGCLSGDMHPRDQEVSKALEGHVHGVPGLAGMEGLQ